MTVTPEQVRELITAVGLEHRVSDIMVMLQPSIAIRTTRHEDSAIPLGQSKFGGMPDLPPGIAWPDYEGRPLDFVAQINLADVVQYHHDQRLPASGRLYFFFDKNRYYGDELWRNNGKGSYQVIYDDGDVYRLKRSAEPDNLEIKYVTCALTFFEELTLPDFSSYQIATAFGWNYNNLSEDERDIDAYFALLSQLAQTYPGDHHVLNRIFGYPDVIQTDVMIEAEAAAHNLAWDQCRYEQRGDEIKTWQLLLQVDSDNNAKMMWGDVGKLYYCIQAKALRERRFDAAVCITQCT